MWLEPNTVEVGGKIRVFARAIIDEKATANIAAVLEYDEAANELRFTQFTSWPGGQCKFFIIDDQPNRMYWMLGNLVTNSQDLLGWGDRMRETKYTGGPGNERRWLFLHYSIDCLNWFPAGCVARWPDSVHRSFMYPSAAIDGDDLVILSRTSRDAENQHDADLCTIHRVRDFRSLAMDLRRGGWLISCTSPRHLHVASASPRGRVVRWARGRVRKTSKARETLWFHSGGVPTPYLSRGSAATLR